MASDTPPPLDVDAALARAMRRVVTRAIAIREQRAQTIAAGTCEMYADLRIEDPLESILAALKEEAGDG